MIDYKLYNTVEKLEKQVDELHKEVYILKQQQQNMLEQINKLKERDSDGSGK